MNSELYLKKLNVIRQEPSLGFLNELITAHQKVISFNNFHVFFNPGRILNLELDSLFEKVIVLYEGGYCFENNKVFYYLLKELGFDVQPRAGRVTYGHAIDKPRTHRITLVTIEGKRYLADVGFGRDVATEAIPLEAVLPRATHMIELSKNLFRLQLLKHDSVIELYTFDDGHYEESDFFVGNYYTSTHPDSKFVKELIVVRIERDLTELISGRKYSRIENDERKDFEIKDQSDFQTYLGKFGIDQVYDFTKVPGHAEF